MKRQKRNDNGVAQALVMVMQFGINMLVPICLMSALGVWLDKKFDTSFWMIILFFVGALAGGQNVYRMAKQVYGGSEQKPDEACERSGKDKQELDREHERSDGNDRETEKEK